MKRVKTGIVGLGRMGQHYARNLSFRVRNADLLAACSINDSELAFARNELYVQRTYTDFDEMLAREDLEAVFIISSTSEHAGQMIKALHAGLHVFCEKPLALEVDSCLAVEAAAAQHPRQIALVGFVRRFDPSYVYARKKVDEGVIGRPFFVKSQTVDIDATAEFQIEYLKSSGGMFLDFNVHDIDLARWFLNSNLKTVFAAGGAFKHPEFAAVDDADNVLSSCVFENGTMASLHASRTALHGHDTCTEIVGTEGTLRIGSPPVLNRVEISDRYGVRRECAQTFYERFEEAFLLQTEDFINCIIEGRKPELTLQDATEATRAAAALTRSFREKRSIEL